MFEPDPKDARILVVDDEPANVKLLQEMLSRAGFHNIMGVEQSSLVLERVRSFEPDLVLLDLHMPPPTGYDILTALPELVPDDQILPVIVITADVTERAKLTVLGNGAHDFLTKPFDYAELLLRVKNLLTIRFQHEELRRNASVMTHRLHVAEELERASVERRQAITRRTERVIDRGVVPMAFQPIVDLATGAIIGAEALARFEADPEDEAAALRSPADWFREAAEVGLATQLELAAVSSALAGLDALPANAFLSVNVSADTLRSPAIRHIFGDVDLSRLVLELTEREQVDDYEGLSAAMTELRRLGARLAVDDTGSGFSSLRHIVRLHPDVIKIDRSFVSGIDVDASSRAIVAGLVQLSADSTAMLVAEGVETTEEQAALQALGVQHAQGFLFGKPGPLPLSVAAH